MVLVVKQSKVFAERTGEFAGKREVGSYDSKLAALVPKTEAPTRFFKTQNGWTAIVTVYLPEEFDFDASPSCDFIFSIQMANRPVWMTITTS